MSVHILNPQTDAMERVRKLKESDWLTPVGLSPTGLTALTPQMANDLLLYATFAADMSDWVVADLLIWIEHTIEQELGTSRGREFWDRRNDKWVEFVKASKRTYTFHTLYAFSATAKAFPWYRRRQSAAISFEHYRLLANKNEQEQERLLDEIEAMEMSVVQLRLILYGKISEDGATLKPVLSARLPATCPNCGFILEDDE